MEYPLDTANFTARSQTTQRPKERKESTEICRSTSRQVHGTINGNFLPFAKRPFGCRPVPALARKPEYIYLIGHDSDHPHKRQTYLEEAGYKVIPITPEIAIQESRRAQITVSIFCESLSSLERVQIAASFRRYSPETRLLLVSQRINLDFEVMLFHSVVVEEDGPDAVIEAVHKLAQTT